MTEQTTQICIKCKKEKKLCEFYKKSDRRIGVSSICKECDDQRKKNSIITESSKIKRKIYKKQYTIKNKETINLKTKEYREKNKEIIKLRFQEHKERNKIIIKERIKLWVKNNKEKSKEIHKKYRKKNKHAVVWRNFLKDSLRRMKRKKNDSTINLLGYSAIDLKNHIESLFTEGMSWDNHGEWHIDHIKRVREFHKDTHPSVVNALSNLRPLWATTREINGVVYEGNINRG